MSKSYRSDHEERLVETLEEHRDEIKRVAQSETEFAKRAESALEWLEEHTEEVDDEE